MKNLSYYILDFIIFPIMIIGFSIIHGVELCLMRYQLWCYPKSTMLLVSRFGTKVWVNKYHRATRQCGPHVVRVNYE